MLSKAKTQKSKLSPDRVSRIMNLINAVNPQLEDGSALVPLDSKNFQLSIHFNDEVEDLKCVKSEIKRQITIPREIRCTDYNVIGVLATKLDTEEYCELKFPHGSKIDFFQQRYHLMINANDIDGNKMYVIFKFTKSFVKLMLFPISVVHDKIANFYKIATFTKIPLVLDLDDTVVRAVSPIPNDPNPKVVLLSQKKFIQHRIRPLVNAGYGINELSLATDVDIFLEQISRFYDIFVCSAGEPQYVENVCKVLDPDNIYFKEIESTRHMYIYNKEILRDSNLPTKDLARLFPFCVSSENSILANNFPLILKMTKAVIIIDDIDHAWLPNQRQQLYLMLPIHPIWDVNLELCATVLQHMYHSCGEDRDLVDIPYLLKAQIMFLMQQYFVRQLPNQQNDFEELKEIEAEENALDEMEDITDEVTGDLRSLESTSLVESLAAINGEIPEGVEKLFPNQDLKLLKTVDKMPDMPHSISKFK